MAGLISSPQHAAHDLSEASFVVANPGRERRQCLQERYGVSCVEDAALITEAPDVVFIAVKPQLISSVLTSLRDLPAYGGKAGTGPLFVSVAAGITTKRLRELLPEGARVVRTMPNTPLLVGAGMTAVVGDGGASDEDVDLVYGLFACLGRAVVVDELQMDAVCAVSGSGPAYVAAMVESMRDGGVKQGLSYDLAETLALQTVLGTARLIHETNQAPQDVRRAVCSPGGTTLAALDAMDKAGFSAAVEKGVAAATQRSFELGAQS